MRIVMVANWWYPRGGLGTVMFQEARALESLGHEVIPFAAAHPDNLRTPWSMYFPRFVETAAGGAGMAPGARGRAALSLMHNAEAARCFASLLDASRPDLIHVHNTVRQLSPAVLQRATKRRIPCVMTAHDYSLVCPQGVLLKGSRTACAAPNCLNGNVLNCIGNRCVKGSVAVSGLAAFENLLHRASRAYTGRLKAIITPSRFAARQLATGGVPRRLLRYLPNGLPGGPDPAPLPERGGTVLYAGRLSIEKGLGVLLRAAAELPHVAFSIAGDGPLLSELRRDATPNVRFLGLLAEPEMQRALERAAVVVSPSICHDNAPMAVLEAMRAGRVPVVTDLGGQPELVGEAGLVVPAGDSRALAHSLKHLFDSPEDVSRIGAAARSRFLAAFTLERHLAGLQEIYRGAMLAQEQQRG